MCTIRAAFARSPSLKGANRLLRRRLQTINCELPQYIRKITELTNESLTPEIILHLITPNCALWHGRADCKVPDPYWAFYWPGGQALTRYILDNPHRVKDQCVLDVGSGCGASAIASVMSGARHVIANDICQGDPNPKEKEQNIGNMLFFHLENRETESIVFFSVAAEAMKMNTRLNNIRIEISTDNFIGQIETQWDTIILGDMFYDTDFANDVTDWLRELHLRGKQILIGDPGRITFLEHPIKTDLFELVKFELPLSCRKENNGLTHASVWSFKKDSPD